MPQVGSPRLLLIEDDPDTAGLIRETLCDHFGADCVQHCTTVARALSIDTAVVDLVLTDMNLPDGTGLDVLSKLLRRRPDLPIVVVTGEGIMDNAIRAIRQGAYDYIVKAGDYLFALPIVVEKNLEMWRTKRDNMLLQRQLTSTLEEVRVKNQQLQEAVRQLETMAATDPLTGLANRRSFNQALERCFAEANRYGHDLTCIMIDLDAFKQLNDTLGHQMGDELLQRTARVLEANCRRSDVAGRYGGDEFIVLLPQTDLDTARQVAGRINEQFHTDARQLIRHSPAGASPACQTLAERISMSMGIACLRHSRPPSAEAIIAQADHALYRAKQAGKTCFMVYETPASIPTPVTIKQRPSKA